MADRPFNSVRPFIPASFPRPTDPIQSTRAPSTQLIHFPAEILGVVFRQMDDFHSLFACRQTCRRMDGIYRANRARCSTHATLNALATRGIELREPCLFADVIMKDGRQPSMYLKPAIRALYQGQPTLCQDFCRALLGLRYFVGYDVDASFSSNAGWKYQSVTDEAAMRRHCHLDYNIKGHLITVRRMSALDVEIVREVLGLRHD